MTARKAKRRDEIAMEGAAALAAHDVLEKRTRSSARWIRIAGLLREAAHMPQFRRAAHDLVDEIADELAKTSAGDIAVKLNELAREAYDDQLDAYVTLLADRLDRLIERKA